MNFIASITARLDHTKVWRFLREWGASVTSGPSFDLMNVSGMLLVLVLPLPLALLLGLVTRIGRRSAGVELLLLALQTGQWVRIASFPLAPLRSLRITELLALQRLQDTTVKVLPHPVQTFMLVIASLSETERKKSLTSCRWLRRPHLGSSARASLGSVHCGVGIQWAFPVFSGPCHVIRRLARR